MRLGVADKVIVMRQGVVVSNVIEFLEDANRALDNLTRYIR